ncbi:MAG: hypothetical protein AAGD06_26530 [Acidobacteriota bacterium]
MSQDRSPDPRLANVLLLLASLGFGLAVVCGVGWWLAARGPVHLADLDPEARRQLGWELMSVSPGVYAPASFEPRIGYTLGRRKTITAWNDTFEANALGFRTGPVAKERGTFRILFVGDSWTFGMGVRRHETFAEVAAGMAADHAGLPGPVEAWILALPGYNTPAQVAALRSLFDRLEPDAVVICPTPNDNHSLPKVLANGSLAFGGMEGDAFGDPHPVTYRIHLVDSHRYDERWRVALGQLAEVEAWLGERRIPLMFFFTGTWPEPMVHRLMLEGGLTSPFAITPPTWTTEAWRNPQPVGHPTAEAHRRYARVVYRSLAELLGWGALPDVGPGEDVPLWRRPSAGEAARARGFQAKHTVRGIGTGFDAESPESFRQCVAPSMDCPGGGFGRGATVLVRRRDGATRLSVTVRRLADIPSVYPLDLMVTIPSPAGGSRRSVTVPADGDPDLTFDIDIPGDLRPGVALDVTFEVDAVSLVGSGPTARSLALRRIEQI